jgi:glycerophosphoryl diester phosphodiesterase
MKGHTCMTKANFSARRIIAVIFTMLIICSMLTCFPSKVSAENVTIKNVEPAILVNAGDTVNLSGYSVEFSDKTVTDKIKWTYNGSEVKEFKAEEAKVYPLVAESGDLKQNVYIVAKKASDSEYVLYSNDFSDANAIDGWNRIIKDDGIYSINDGKLEINAIGKNNPRIYLPSWLADFGNYRIDAVATQKEPTDTSRWFSFIWRAQDSGNTGTPYYHMTIRNNMTTPQSATTGGIECCSYVSSWNYYKSASYTETVNPNKYYTFSVLLKDKTVQYQIDGNTVIHLDNLPQIADTIKGGVGIQVNSSKVYVDSIKISIQKNTPEYVEPEVPQLLQYVTDPQSNILNTPTNIAIIDSEDTLKGLQDGKPSNAVMYIDSSLNVNKKDGTKITTVEEALPSFGKNIIPAFYVKDKDTVTKITEFLKNKKIVDALIISPDADVAKYAIELYPTVRHAVDFSEMTDELNNETLFKIRATTTGAKATLAILPMKYAQSDSLYYLHRLGLAVWVMNDNVSGKTDIATMITSGANGIISNDYKAVADAFVNLFVENTLTRTTLIVGHRGNPSQAPENTLSSYLKAIENGADCVETDVYLTKDNHVIIMHDGTLKRTTSSDSDTNITQMTLEEIKQFYCWGDSDQFKSAYPEEKVPTLEELFEAIKDKDTVVFLEIKDGRVELIQALADLIKKYNFENRVFIISFNSAQLTRINDALPSLGTGFLMSATSEGSSVAAMHDALYNDFLKYHASFSTFDPGYKSFTKEYYAALRHRGIPVFPWTYTTNTAEDFDKSFLYGADSITTNDAQYSKAMIKKLISSTNSIDVAVNEAASFSAESLTYGGTKKTITGEGDASGAKSDNKNMFIAFIEGEDVASYENGTIKGLKEGTATFMVGFKARTSNGKQYVLYTQPITVNVKSPVSQEPTESNYLPYYIAGGLLVILGGVFALTKTKKKESAK